MFNYSIPSLTAFNFTNTAELTSLSSALGYTEAVLLSARAALSAVPRDPYEIMKLTYFDKDHKFPTIDDVKVPESVSLETMQVGFDRVINQHHDKILKEITEKDTPLTDLDSYSMLSELSGDKWITTPDKYRKYIEFFEVLRTVDVKSLTSADIARDVARKFSYTLLQALTHKTIQN